MPKNIVVCSDGTGNAANKKRGTNVYKLFEAVDVHQSSKSKIRQFKVYDDGVGTHRLKPIKAVGLAFGFGLKRNVQELYEAIARAYEPGDQIYMFGFSRGAFTVRLLAGFIAQCGIPKVGDEEPLSQDKEGDEQPLSLHKTTKKAWRAYRHRYAALLERMVLLKRPNEAAAEVKKYIDEFDPHPARIRFIGVWDTVDAYGFPTDVGAWFVNTFIFRYTFKGQGLSEKVDYGRHALAIDDERKTFHPTLWDEDPKRIRQVWFSGAHSDVGGGYPKQGLSLLTLHWMVSEVNSIKDSVDIPEDAEPEEREVMELQNAGLQWVPEDTTYFESHSNSDDVYHNPRSGLAVYYRYRPRRIDKLWDEVKSGEESLPLIHDSVLRRIQSRTYGYAPRAIPMNFKRETTGKGVMHPDIGLGSGSSAYDISAQFIRTRFLVQYILYVATALFAGQILCAGAYSTTTVAEFFGKLFSLSGVGKFVAAAYKEQTLPMLTLTAVFVIIALTSFLLRLKIGSVCKKFWDDHRSTIYKTGR